MNEEMEHILIVDDDINLCRSLHNELSEVGYPTHYVTTVNEALKFMAASSADLLLLNLQMLKQNSFNILRYIEYKKTNTKVVALTPVDDYQNIMLALKMGASDFLCKPIDFDELLISIRKVLYC